MVLGNADCGLQNGFRDSVLGVREKGKRLRELLIAEFGMPAAPKRQPAEPSCCRGWRGERFAE